MDAADGALLLVRLVVGGTMIAHGLNHWIGGGRIEGTARWFSGLGLRHGRLQAWASVVTEVGAGVLIAVGLLTPFACAAVVSVMLVAGLLAHRSNGFFVFRDGYEYVMVLGAVAIALGMLGPGAVSIDHIAGIVVEGWGGGLVAAGVGIVATAVLLGACWRPVAESDTETSGRDDGADIEVIRELEEERS